MAFGRSNNSVEVPVTLGLQEAQRQIAELRKQLNDGVKAGSGGFDFITKVLDKAQNQADKLGGKLGEAFKTSNSAKSFMREYQSMIEMLSTAKAKMGNLGFEEIKFSVKDQEVIDNAVKQIQELSATLENIKSGKAIELINSSSVEGVENLRTQIGNLIKDTSELTFDGLNKTLQEASNEAGAKVNDLTNKIKTLESTINTISADGLSSVQAAVNSTSQNNSIGKSLVNAQDINEANERLRQFANTLSDIPDKLKSFTVGRDENVAKFVQEQTDKIEKEYQRQINVVKDNRDKVQSILTAINNTGARYNSSGKKTTTAWTNEQKEALLNSTEMQAAVQATNLNLKKIFEGLDETDVSGRFKKIKAALEAEAQSLGIKEENLTNLRDSFKSNFSAIFDDLGETVVLKQRDVQNKLKEALNGLHIDPSVLKEFGFDINNIRNGQDLANVYDQLKSSLDAYVQSLEAQKQSLSSGELENAKRAQEELNNAITTAAKVQEESGSSAEGLQKQIDSLRKTIEDLVNKYNQLTGKKITFNTDEINKGKSAIDGAITALDNLNKKQQALSNVQSAVTRWMGFYQVLNLTKRAVKEMVSHITELDTVMTQIAVVTNMSQDDLWGQIGQYSEIARQYGVAIKGVYEVSQIYYQQGLNKGDVMNLTTETLKMARIAGIDYATAADYMTTAIRGFKLEMTEAARVTDVFSNLAAHTASDTEELATAISKTASSAEAVGASFEATSAMIATMVSVTRESATNIGTALKSVISRYGEMTSDPTKLVDSEGEEMSLNRVDKALRTIGITIQDTNGQFRDFDDVILELGDKWDSLDKNAQRYIATIMAGNRQQSRFLALVGNVDEYRRALELANNSEDTGELQTLKTLDSIDAKMERMKVTIQEFYTSSGIQDLYKNILDTITNVISGANKLPKIFGNLPVTALALGAQIIAVIKNIAQLVIATLQNNLNQLKLGVSNTLQDLSSQATVEGQKFGKNWFQAAQAEMNQLKNKGATTTQAFFGSNKIRAGLMVASTIASGVGAAFNLDATSQYGASKNVKQDEIAGLKAGLGGGISNAVSGAISGLLMSGGNPIIAGISAIANALPSIISGINMYNVTLSRRIELAEKVETEAKQQATLDQGKVNDLQQAYDKLNDLSSKQYESTEAMAEYHEYMNQLADSYPALVSAMETNGNQIITLESLERALAETRADAAASALAEVKAQKDLKLLQRDAWKELQIGTGSQELIIDEDIPNPAVIFETIKDAFDLIISDVPTVDASVPSIADYYENPMEGILLAYNQAVKYLQDYDLDYVPDSIISYNPDNIEQVYKENQQKIIEFVQGFMQDNNIAYNSSSELRTKYRKILEKAIENNDSLTLERLTGFEEIDLSDIEDSTKLNDEDLKKAIQHTREVAQDGIDEITDEINAVDSFLSQSSANVVVQNNLKENSKTASDVDLTKYSTFLSSMIARYKAGIDYSKTGTNLDIANRIYGELSDYIDQNQFLVDDLINMQFSQFKGGLDQFNQFLADHNFTEQKIDSSVINSLRDDFLTTTKLIRKNFAKAILTNVGKSSNSGLELYKLFDDIKTDDNIIGEIVPILQSQLPKYQELQSKGYTIAAENYLNGLITLYQQVGQLTEEQQKSVAPLLRELDLTDVQSVDSTIQTLNTMGFTEIANQLQETRNALANNLSLAIDQMTSSASEVLEEAEKVIGNVGKGMEFSDAIKTAQEIINKSNNKDRIATDLTEFNSELGQWTLTSDALYESYQQVVDEHKSQVEALNKSMQVAQSIKDTLLSQSEYAQLTVEDFSGAGIDLAKIVGTDNVDNELNKFNQALETLKVAFDKSGETDWKVYLEQHYNELDLGQKNLEMLESFLQNSPLTAIMKLDFNAIAGGTSSSNIKEKFMLYMKMLGGEAAGRANEIWQGILDANFKPLEDILGVDISQATERSAMKENAEQYLTAIKELTDDSITILSDSTVQLLGIDTNNKASLSPEQIKEKTDEFQSALEAFKESGILTITDWNDVLLKQLNKTQQEDSKTLKVLEIAKDGFTGDELTSFVNEFGGNLGDYVDTSTNELKGALASVFTYDSKTTSYIPIANASQEQIFAALEAAFGISLEGFTDAATETIDKQIAQRAKNNQGKQIASQLKNLSSANVGDEINVNSLTEEMQAAIGATGGTLTIMSEYQRDNILLLLDTYIKGYEGQGKEALEAIYYQIESSIKASNNRSSGLSGILNTKVSNSDAEAFVKSIGTDVTETSNIMTARGYIWNIYSKEWEATTNVLRNRERDIANAMNNKASAEQIAEINTFYDNLEDSLDEILGANSALNTILQNYTSVSNEDINNLKAKFERAGYDNIPWEQFITDNGETSSIDASALIAYLKNIGFEFNDAVKESIAGITDNYLSAISSAASYMSSGFTSQADIESFIESYNSTVVGGKLSATNFHYDEILDAFTINPLFINSYIEAQKEKLIKSGFNEEDAEKYIKNQTIKSFAAAIDIDSYISSGMDRESISGQQLKKQLSDWFSSKNQGRKITEYQLNHYLDIIESGDQAAVELMSNIAKDAGRDLSSEEMQKYYAPLAEKYSSMASKLAELTVGQYVAEGDMRGILEKTGVVDETTGLVTSVKNMAKAYKDIYDNMKVAAGRTQKQLNSVYASYLTSSKKSEIDAISTLNDAMGMTYEALGELLGDYGKSLETFANNLSLYGLEDIGGGQVRINDFRAFASGVGLTDSNSEAYISAFKAYNDSLIALDNSTRNAITEEVQAIASANPGERVNLTTYWTSLDKAAQASINTSLLNYGGLITDGILRISEQADIKGIIDAILSQNDLKDNLLPDQIAALYDTLDATLTGMIDSVRSAAEGTISGEDFAKLHNWAQQSYNIDIGQGVKTSEGYQMNEDALFALYNSVSKVDSMLAKSMIPDLSKVSSQYKTLPDLLKAYANATNEAKKSLLKAAISSQLRNPDNYNIMGGELPTTWQIAENFYGDAKKAQTVTNQMINKGQVGVSDFSSLMQLIMSGDNAADRQQALEWMQSAPEFFVETSDGLMINTAKMGIKNLKELNRMWIEAAEVLRQNGAKEQEVYNLLYYGSESLQNAEITDDEGNISAQKIKEIADAKTKQGENVKNLLDNIKINNKSLYDYLNDKNLDSQFTEDMRDKLLTTLANTNWDFENFDDETLKMFKDTGLKGTVKIDGESGQITFEYNQDATTVEKVYTYGGTTFNDVNEYLEFLALTDKDGFTEISTGSGKDKTVTGGTYKVNDEIDVTIEIESGSVIYSFTTDDGKKFTATNEASIMQAIADWAPKPEGGEIEGSQETISYTVSAGDAQVKVIYDQKGKRQLLFDPDESADLADEVRANTAKTIEIPTPVTAVATVEELQAKLDSNAQVNIAKDAGGNVTVTWAEANGNIKSITLTPDELKVSGLQEKINELLQNTGATLVITPDTSAVDGWVKTFNPTKVVKIKPEIVGDTNLHLNISYTKSDAKGNVALAAGTQSTLMGELGPELWVSGGHYYIAGRNGAEFVDLPKDAIVFNHLQTARLLGTGASGRGTPITNDRAAVALAHGNWNGGPAYGPGNTLGKPTGDSSKGSNSGSNKNNDVQITLSDDAKSKLSSLISDALSKGFENLDWSDYEKELGSMMDEIKNTARINYRTFVDTYASQCDKTTSEINELYFQAWQKDLEDSMDSEDIVSAAEGLNFYANGNIGGSASDWQSIIGDRALITDLVKKGIMSYDAATKQYFVTNAEALANAGVDISQIEGIQEMIYDSLRSQYDQIVDYISNGLEGSLTSMDSKSLQSLVERMGITGLQLDFEQTVNGLKLSQASAISLYNELKKVDSIAAQLTFNELVENLQESNDDYKTMTSLLSHIEDLSLKIQDANSYSDERIKQYTEELALAKEIAAVRATSADESMSWYDESIPAGMQNVLDYRQSWADAIDMMRDAQETGVFDFTGFINTAKQINSQAQTLGQTLNFCGYELNGTSEAIDAFITAAANSLGAVTTDSGTNFGVVLEKFGADLTDGAASYENSATSAMQTFAKSQIQILDGLIQMFEMIVAMESFKGVDEDDNGLLDWKEIFNLDELEANSTEFAQYIKTDFKTAAQQILDNAGSNKDLQKALTSVKVDGNTMQELLEYATGAIDKLTYSMTAGDYWKAMSVFYKLLASGDYDLDNIASSLKEALATSGSDFKGTIEYGDFVLDMKYGVTISKTSTGTYKSKSGQEYPTAAEACKATVLEEAGLKKDQIVWSEDKEVASGTVTYKSFSVEIIADAEGARYNYNGVAYNSLEDATMAAWNAAGGEQGTQLTFDEWKIQQGITIVTTVSEVDTSNISKSQIDKLVGTSWQEIKAKWDAATGDKEAEEEFKIEYGFTLDGASEADFNEMKERLGITENRMELTLAITNLDEIAAEFASKMTNITLNPTSADATGSATVTADTTEAVTSIGAVEEAINKVIKAIEYLNTLKVAIDKGTAEADMQAIKDATKKAEEAVGNLNGAVSGLTTQFGSLNGTLSTLQTYLSGLSNSTISIHAVGQEVLGTIAQDLRSISTDIASLKEKEVKGQIVLNITTGGGSGGNQGEMATGNVIGDGALAAGSRQVLMGELGPELYVTGGRYYVAGQGGAEFVNLPNDAIVFNHLQTRKLLSTGAAGRGKPVTNEKAATSLATGNIMGLAMANAQQTLATLKQLRAMWQSIANASITDMVGLVNMKDTESSSDGGGSDKIDRKAWIETLEKWYNWLQKIAELEKEINYEEQLRNTLETRQGPKGKELYESQKRELEMIKQQYAVQKSLVDSRREYFEARRAQLNSSVFGKFYQFDEHGQQFYTRGTKFEFGKTADYVAAQKAAQASGGNGATTTTMTNVAPEMTKHTAEWNKSIENLALAIYNTRASNQASRLSDGSISYKMHHYETIDKALQMAQTMYRIDENGKATYLGNSTAKGDPLAYSDVSGRLWNIWEQNIGVEFDRLQSGEKQRSNIDQNILNQSSEYKKLLSQTIQDTAKAVGQEVGGGSTGGGVAGANPPRSELAQITQIEGGFAALMELWARDPQTLEPKYTPAEQYAIAQSLGFGNYMLYDQSGNKIEPGENGQDDTFYTSALQALTDNLDADREEMQSLYDSIEEDEKKLLELEQKQNEILLAIRDNQIDVENKILDAIEAREQAIIDELSDTKEVLEDNADKYINGLNEALSNEQRMYQSNKSQNELESLRRQLAILQRSGGSASQINSLQQQIDAKEQENYFDAQQEQIDAIQAASDLEIERLDKQIEIMETTLEFSKEHGLLWAEVSQIMQQDDGVIMDFLLSNTAEYLASSTLQQSATYDELLSMVTQWTAYRDDQNKYRPLQEDMEVGLEDIMANIFSTDANVEDSNVISAIIGANAQVTQGMYAVATAATAAASAATASSGVNTSNYSSQSSGSTNSTSSGTPNRYARDAYLGYDPADNPFYAYNDSMLYSGLYGEGINNIYGNMNNSTAIVNENAVFDSLVTKMAKLTGQDEEQVRKDFTFAQGYTHMHASETGTNYWNYLNERDNKYLAQEQERVKTLQDLVANKGADTPSAFGGTIGEALAKEQERLNQAQEAVDTHANAEKALQTYKDAKSARLSELILEGKTRYQAEQILKEEGYVYSKGGSVPVTGLVSVHGTPQRPEYFLDAEETQMWKHDILGGNSSSLTSRLLALREILNGIESASSHINNSTDNGVIIEKAEVNVDVAQLANDYDARRAGDTIMDEILQIARKTGVSSVRR